MTDSVVTVIELPVGAFAPRPPRRQAPAGRAAGLTAPAPTAPSTTAGSGHRRSTTVTRCLDATERLRHQPTDRQHAQRLTAA